MLAAATLVLGACSSGGSGEPPVTLTAPAGTIQLDAAAAGTPIDPRLFGTNAPAWVGPEHLADPAFRARVQQLGTTVVRMPGGSWSSSYDWLGCENDDASTCYWTWAARPTDYVDFLAATGVAGMWTVSFNGTAQEAAALVAFFNGEVGNTQSIGVDRHGRDWGTVGEWAQLRADHGHPAPQPIRLWEVGNEVFGAKAKADGDCASFGWEDVWTCDGDHYVHGDDEHDGYLAFRDAMRAVDPDIEVGAVGIGGDQGGFADFGNEVIDGTAGALDFYIVHDYGFGEDGSVADVLKRPVRAWPTTMKGVDAALAAAAPDRRVPVGVTEYNLFAFADGDDEQLMNQAVAALYVADTLGQMAERGVSMANHWNLWNGAASNGADYGMIDVDSLGRHPQYDALAIWTRFGKELLPVGNGFDAATQLSVYAGRRADGAITLLVINKTGAPVEATLQLAGLTGSAAVTADVVAAESPHATSMTVNGDADPLAVFAAAAPASLPPLTDGQGAATFEPWSITLLTITPA